LPAYRGRPPWKFGFGGAVNTRLHSRHSNVRRSGFPDLRIDPANRIGFPQPGHSAGRSLLMRRTNEPIEWVLGRGYAGNRHPAFQNLGKLGCLEPTVGQR
jgi:hypothetical protein